MSGQDEEVTKMLDGLKQSIPAPDGYEWQLYTCFPSEYPRPQLNVGNRLLPAEAYGLIGVRFRLVQIKKEEDGSK